RAFGVHCQPLAHRARLGALPGGKMKALFCRALILVCLCSLISLRPVLAQYTDPAVINDLGGPQEFARRRQELAKQMKQGILVLFARTRSPSPATIVKTTIFSISP